MENGIHNGVSFAAYCEIKAANQSGLGHFLKSPAHYRASLEENRRETRDQMLGTSIHCATLEPLRFLAEYSEKPEPEQFPGCLVSAEDYKNAAKTVGVAVAGTKDAVKARIQEASNAFRFFDDIEREAMEAGATMLTAEDFEMVTTIARKFRHNPAAMILFSDGLAEQTLIWEEDGVKCKARLDWVTADHWIVDVKSTKDAREDEFAKQAVGEYGYDRQAAWYLRGYEMATGIKPKGFIFACVEKTPPYASAFFEAPEEMIAKGLAEIMPLFKRYAECVNSGEWPAYPDGIRKLKMPAWAKAKEAPSEPGDY